MQCGVLTYAEDMNAAELAELDDPDGPNEPDSMVSHRGAGGGQLSLLERRQRRSLMDQMLAQGVEPENIIWNFEQKFQMTESAIRQLITEVRAMWDEDDAEGMRYERTAQKRRLLGAIRECTKDRKWTALANLEGTYAQVSGTDSHEEEKPMDVDSRLSECILAVINETDPKEIRILIEKDKMFMQLSSQTGVPEIPVKAAIVESGV